MYHSPGSPQYMLCCYLLVDNGDHYNEVSVNDHQHVVVSGQIGQQLLLLQQLS